MAVQPIVRVQSVLAANTSTQIVWELDFLFQMISVARFRSAKESSTETFVMPSMRRAHIQPPAQIIADHKSSQEAVSVLRKYWIAKYGKGYEIPDNVTCQPINIGRVTQGRSCPPTLTYPSIFLCSSFCIITEVPEVQSNEINSLIDHVLFEQIECRYCSTK